MDDLGNEPDVALEKAATAFFCADYPGIVWMFAGNCLAGAVLLLVPWVVTAIFSWSFPGFISFGGTLVLLAFASLGCGTVFTIDSSERKRHLKLRRIIQERDHKALLAEISSYMGGDSARIRALTLECLGRYTDALFSFHSLRLEAERDRCLAKAEQNDPCGAYDYHVKHGNQAKADQLLAMDAVYAHAIQVLRKSGKSLEAFELCLAHRPTSLKAALFDEALQQAYLETWVERWAVPKPYPGIWDLVARYCRAWSPGKVANYAFSKIFDELVEEGYPNAAHYFAHACDRCDPLLHRRHEAIVSLQAACGIEDVDETSLAGLQKRLDKANMRAKETGGYVTKDQLQSLAVLKYPSSATHYHDLRGETLHVCGRFMLHTVKERLHPLAGACLRYERAN